MRNSLFVSLLMCCCLVSCNNNSSTNAEIKAEESFLPTRIANGYFNREFVDSYGKKIDLSYVYIIIKHEYSVSDKYFTVSDFSELEIKMMYWNYTVTSDSYPDDYRIKISVTLFENEDDYYINSIKSLTNNVFVYDAYFIRDNRK